MNLQLILRAIRPETNVNRVYKIRIDKGLFNSWLVITAYGCYGKGACQKIHSFLNKEEARAYAGKTLRKRFQSHKRIGCCYKIVKAKGISDIVPIF